MVGFCNPVPDYSSGIGGARQEKNVTPFTLRTRAASRHRQPLPMELTSGLSHGAPRRRCAGAASANSRCESASESERASSTFSDFVKGMKESTTPERNNFVIDAGAVSSSREIETSSPRSRKTKLTHLVRESSCSSVWSSSALFPGGREPLSRMPCSPSRRSDDG